MLLDAIIIVLRETIEAGVLISLLLSMGNRENLSRYWLWLGLLAGTVWAALYMIFLGEISSWFDYVGQEVVGAFLQYGIFFCLLLLVNFLLISADKTRIARTWLMGITVMLALVREGGEIMVFFSGFWLSEKGVMHPLTSGFVGLMIGMSVGALCYYLFTALSEKYIRWVQIPLLTLVAGGMVAQASQLMIQADWFPTAMPLWNSEFILPERSVFGTLAYAVFGYESTPSALEVGVYFSALLTVPISVGIMQRLLSVKNKPAVLVKES